MSHYPLEQQLEDAGAHVRTLQEDLAREQTRRDKLVRQALKRGWSHARISEATGLTRSRVGQIAKEKQ